MDNKTDKISYTPILITFLIIASFLIGSLTTKIQYMEKASGQVAGVQAAPDAPNQPPRSNSNS